MFGQQDHFFSLVDSLSAIRALSRMPIEGVSEEQLLARALEALIEYQDLEQCSIFLPEGDELKCAVGGGQSTFARRVADEPSTDYQSMRFNTGEGIMGLALQSGQIQYCRNCNTDSRFKPYNRTALFYGDGSLISAPIVSDDEVLGVLNVSHHQPEFFQTWHQHFLMLFANFLGRLLHLHRLVNQLEDQVASRTHALAQSLEESEKLRTLHQELSVMDELTGLYNRRHFFMEGQAMLARALRYDHPLGLMLIELDQLKRINDQRGHQVGDQAIAQIARMLQKEARTGDMLARLGDGEFALTLPHTVPAGMESVAERIQQSANSLGLSSPDGPVQLTVSIGMTTFRAQADMGLQVQLDRLYHQADCAVDYCKQQGGGRHLFYSPGLELTDGGELDGLTDRA